MFTTGQCSYARIPGKFVPDFTNYVRFLPQAPRSNSPDSTVFTLLAYSTAYLLIYSAWYGHSISEHHATRVDQTGASRRLCGCDVRQTGDLWRTGDGARHGGGQRKRCGRPLPTGAGDGEHCENILSSAKNGPGTHVQESRQWSAGNGPKCKM